MLSVGLENAISKVVKLVDSIKGPAIEADEKLKDS